MQMSCIARFAAVCAATNGGAVAVINPARGIGHVGHGATIFSGGQARVARGLCETRPFRNVLVAITTHDAAIAAISV